MEKDQSLIHGIAWSRRRRIHSVPVTKSPWPEARSVTAALHRKALELRAESIRLTAYGKGLRPQIMAPADARQILLLSNQEDWQIDSLDLSGASTYGVYVTGDKGPLRHIYLKNLYVHDVLGGPLKNKDNGLVVVGPSGPATVFEDVLVDGVDAAHTNQWSGILVGGGPFAFPEGAPLNRHVRIVEFNRARCVWGWNHPLSGCG